jgi:hypothetical protein
MSTPQNFRYYPDNQNRTLISINMKRTYIYSFILAFVTVSVLFIQGADAIPAFARKYQVSCQVCHSPAIPRLKPFGEEFAANGYRMTKYESPRYFIQTGDDKLSLFREIPLAVRFDGNVTYNMDKSGKTAFTTPFILKLLSSGELSDKISYYFYFLMNEGGSIVGVEDAFFIFKDIFKSGINLYLGQFQASDPLFMSELRLTFEEYHIYDVSPGTSYAKLKYERGMMLERPFKTGTTVQMEILNGCGIDQDIFDTDKHKNFMFRVSQTAGKNLTLGAFLYTGREDLNGLTGPFTSSIRMFGPDLKLNLNEKFMFNLQYVKRTDSRVADIETNGPDIRNIATQGGFAELIFSPKGDMSKWYAAGLVNITKSDISSLDYRSATLHAGYLLRRNVRLVSEYTYQFTQNEHGRVNLGFVSAF